MAGVHQGIFALDTFIANGGDIKIYVDDNTDVYDISFLITKD